MVTTSPPPRAPAIWRLGLYGLKPAFVARLRRLEDAALRRDVSADAITWLAFGIGVATAAVLALGVYVPLLWLTVPPLCLARMACNAVDGSLARRRRAASARGAVLNELGDRAADVVTFAALAPSVGAPLALAVVTVAVTTSFVAVLGHSVLGERFGVGPMGKPDRVAVVSAAAVIAVLVGPTALVVGAWVLLAGGAVTILRRTLVLWQRAGGAG